MDWYKKIIKEYKRECIFCGMRLDGRKVSGVCTKCVADHNAVGDRDKLIYVAAIRKMGKNAKKGIFNIKG